jgi:DNA-binding MarR family transcriptional regulator
MPSQAPHTATSATASATGTRANATANRPRRRVLPTDREAGTRVLKCLRIVFNAVKVHFQQVERRAGLGGAQVWALSLVLDRPGLGVNGLAAAMSVRQPTASNLVRGLAQQDLIEIRHEGPDRRAVQLHIRPQGRRLLRRVPGPFAGVLPVALAGLPPEVLARLEADLGALIEALGAEAPAAALPLAQL